MTAQRAVLTAGLCLLAILPMTESAAADAATPTALGSLRGVAKVDSLFLVQPGVEPFATRPRIDPVAQPQPRAIAPVPGMPRDGGTNLEGLLRDPRASRVTPAGLRLADPGWMRVAPKDRR
ncbi:MAG: hypothetical protein JNM30_06130 [Rhodospirillales bacterium]|nr:hypothetical protein [Rhodospirillales bacterium]